MIRLAVAVVVTLVASATLAAAAPPPRGATTDASAYLLRITIPGQDTVSIGGLEWPTSTTADVQSFQYPADGSSRERRSVARGGLRVTRICRRNAVVRRGDRRLALQRRDRRRQGHGVGVGGSECSFGRSRDEGVGGTGSSRSRPRHRQRSRAAPRSRTGERSRSCRATAEAGRQGLRLRRRR